MNLSEQFISDARELVPEFRVVEKESSFLMKLLKVLLFFMPFERYSTTIGNTVYMPKKKILEFETGGFHPVEILAHELTHVYERKHSRFYSLRYLFPQILAVFAVLSIFSWWWMLCLLFLAPIPAPGRMLIERRGYMMSLLVNAWVYGIEQSEQYIQWAVGQFTGPSYYWMWPFRESLAGYYRMNLPVYCANPFELGVVAMFVHDFIQKESST